MCASYVRPSSLCMAVVYTVCVCIAAVYVLVLNVTGLRFFKSRDVSCRVGVGGDGYGGVVMSVGSWSLVVWKGGDSCGCECGELVVVGVGGWW